jgi:CBS domain-containing protein
MTKRRIGALMVVDGAKLVGIFTERDVMTKVVGAARHPRLIPSMFVLNARGAKLQDNKLILEGIAPSVIVFADRPVRSAGPSSSSGTASRGARRPTS